MILCHEMKNMKHLSIAVLLHSDLAVPGLRPIADHYKDLLSQEPPQQSQHAHHLRGRKREREREWGAK